MKAFVKIFSLSALICLLFTTQGVSQKVDVFEGKLKFLKGQEKLNVKYVYDNMSVGKFDKEEDYIAEKTADKNKDEAGTGDEWARKWVDDREARFEPKFEELFNKHLEDDGLKIGRHEDAQYTLILKTTHTEPGFNVGVMRRPAHINVEAWFVETANMDKVEGKVRMKKVPGQDAMGFDFDTGLRLQEAYAKTGKALGKYLAKKVL